MVSLAYEAVRKRHTHSPIAECLSTVVRLWPGHVQRMDRICLTPNFERYVELSITINDPYLPIELLEVDQLGTLGARVDRIHYRPVARRTLGVRNKVKQGNSHSLGQLGHGKPSVENYL